MKGDRFHNNFFQGTEKKCTGGGLPECLVTTTVKKEVVVNTSKITTRWKRAAVAGHYGKCLLGGIFPKGDRELQYSSPGINPIPNFGLSMSHIKP